MYTFSLIAKTKVGCSFRIVHQQLPAEDWLALKKMEWTKEEEMQILYPETFHALFGVSVAKLHKQATQKCKGAAKDADGHLRYSLTSTTTVRPLP